MIPKIPNETCPKCKGTMTRPIFDLRTDTYENKFRCFSCYYEFKPKEKYKFDPDTWEVIEE